MSSRCSRSTSTPAFCLADKGDSLDSQSTQLQIAIASAAAFAIAELVDWILFTFTRYRLSTRVLLSSLLAAPLDTTIFLYGAGFLTFPNWLMSVIGKLSGAVVVSLAVRRGEREGNIHENE
ncbi:MAG: VUT family protein [Oleibacter sp.]|nr:VUT family protein [Thalassolituus sp.]